MKELLLKDILIPVLGIVLTAFAGYIAAKLKSIYEKKINTETEKQIAETVVKAVEQMYKTLDGDEKFLLAENYIIDILRSKGIKISDDEIECLIEAVVCEFNKSWEGGAKG